VSSRGIVAAGHPLSAEAGARVLREGGNAVDAAIASMLTSFTTEPLLTGPGAAGYMLVAGPGQEPLLLDFFVAAPGRWGEGRIPGDLLPVTVSFGDAEQNFNVGPASVGVWGVPAGICSASSRWGTVPLADLAAPAAALAREGVRLNASQAYVFEILEGILVATPESAALFAPTGRALRAGDVFRSADLGDAIERLGAEGAAPFYSGDIAETVVRWLEERGSVLTRADLVAYEAVPREPVTVAYRGREISTNPPPNAGGVLIALALALLERRSDTSVERLVDVMEEVQLGRTPEFMEGLDRPGFADEHLAAQLGSTTHVSVLDADGFACAVTCTNGEGSGVVIPGTGVHPNNMMGEEDLNPFGFHTFPAGRRMPSMMAPTIVRGADGVELVVGSAGSNRIRSAILQTIVGVVDHGLRAEQAVGSPRVHFESGVVYAEPGIPLEGLRAAGRSVAPFRSQNLFFGGVQAVRRDPGSGELTGAGDPRREGAAVAA
jgi:gamma-glutamyltranspeptidase/glutathione hydrolase